MITHEDQMELFRLISQNIAMDIDCYAFGGTAMMFYGYKDETKDIDILFEKEEERMEFIKALTKLGFAEKSAMKIYIPEKLRDTHRPLMYAKDDIRFDLFVHKIFKTVISQKMKEDAYATHEFKENQGKENQSLKIKVLKKEFIVMLKAVTERDKDFEDILTIMRKDKHFDWQYFIDEVLWQYRNGDSWVLLDSEKMMLELKKYIFIEKKYFGQLYAVNKKAKM